MSTRFLLTAAALVAAAAPAAADGPLDKAVADGVAFLKSRQADDGGWGPGFQKRGVTAIAVSGMLQNGVKPTDPAVAKALDFIETLVNEEEGHIAGKGDRVRLQNYFTCVNVMALCQADRTRFKDQIKNAADYLKKLQYDDGEGKGQGSDYFGGTGYDAKSRPDLSNTQYFLDALKEAWLPQSDPAYRKALKFVSRCQNLKGETNDQPWAGKINDGSFIYSAAAGGSSKQKTENGGLVGYGSMTYAGLKSMIYCGVGKGDRRYKAALEWIKKNYTLKANPGVPPQLGQRGLYYYYHTMAKTLSVMGVDTITDAKGVEHDWRKELAAELISRQRADGSWLNENDRFMEGDPSLVTGFALMALSYCTDKK